MYKLLFIPVINLLWIWSLQKVEFSSKNTSFLLLKFEYTSYLFAIQRFSCTFITLEEYWF